LGDFHFFVFDLELSAVDVWLSQSEKLSSKDHTQSFDGKQKVFARRYPAAAIESERAGGHKTMQMKMIFERLIPSMQDGDDAQCPAKTTSAKLQECLTDGFKEKAE